MTTSVPTRPEPPADPAPGRPTAPIDVSVVVPVYRSEGTLRELTARLLAVLDRTGLRHELVFVDDGSPDDSWRVLLGLRAEHPGSIVALQLMRNFGQHNALMCGFRHSRGRVVVTLDDDLQTPPEEIPKLLAAIEEKDLDLVYGNYGTKHHLPWRNAGSWLITTFYRMTSKNAVTISSYRAVRRELLRCVFAYDLNFTFVDGLFAWNTRRIGAVSVDHHPRREGRSGYSVGKLVSLAFNLFTNFSLLPLQLVSALGLLAAFGGFAAASVYLVLYLMSDIKVPGYASIIISILVMGGIQLMALGIMGEYLGRLHLNVNRKPQYAIRRVAGPAAEGRGPATAPAEAR